LQIDDCRLLIEKIRSLFTVDKDTEITLEANPTTLINKNYQDGKIFHKRLSIGVQSF
jgi:coproporphyrinogen III oxidase-like Fe-S oxidoreductase